MSDKVFFADVEVSVHQSPDILGSRTLLPGQFVPLDSLPDYVQEAVKAGKVEGARVMSKNDAEVLARQAALVAGNVVEDEVDSGEEDTPEVAEHSVPFDPDEPVVFEPDVVLSEDKPVDVKK